MSTPENNQEQQQPQQQPAAQRTYNPFIDVVNEKPYTTMSVAANQSQISYSIPEPSFQPNTIRSNENPYSMLNEGMGGGMGGGTNSGTPPINPAVNNISDSELKMGAENVAKIMVDGYEQLHVFGNKWLQISQRKLRKMVAEGDIDLSVEIPYEYGRTITAGEFIQEFNEQNKDTLTVSKEFKKEVTPVLTRVLQKRGAALTDEQYLGYLVLKDVGLKAIIVTQVKSSMNEMLNVIKDYTQAIKENGVPPTAPPSSPKPTAPTQPRPTSPEPQFVEPDHTSNSFNFEDNETVMAATVQTHKVPDSGRAKAIAARKKDEQMKAAVERAQGKSSGGYEEAMKNKKTGKRGRKPKDYLQMDEEQIAEAIVLRETKEVDKDKIEGLD
jgi:hypothetical protein